MPSRCFHCLVEVAMGEWEKNERGRIVCLAKEACEARFMASKAKSLSKAISKGILESETNQAINEAARKNEKWGGKVPYPGATHVVRCLFCRSLIKFADRVPANERPDSPAQPMECPACHRLQPLTNLMTHDPVQFVPLDTDLAS